MKLTALAQQFIAESPLRDPVAIDATAGNGLDTVFLAEWVGEKGQVHAFDIQQCALQNTLHRLKQAGLDQRVSLHCASHDAMPDFLPADARGRIGACMFNLGYLPGGDHTIYTGRDTTLKALGLAAGLLCSGGRMTVLCYPGHESGRSETAAVVSWFDSLPRTEFDCEPTIKNTQADSPILLQLTRR